MKVLRIFQLLAYLLIFSTGIAAADSLELRNGRHLHGKYIGGTTSEIGFMTGNSVEYFSTADVLVLMFDNGSENSLNGMRPSPMDGKDGAQGELRPLKSRRKSDSSTRLKLRRAAATVLSD